MPMLLFAIAINIFMLYFIIYKEARLMTIGERIRHYRIRRGLSQSELARQAQIGQSTLHGYESGARAAGGMSVDIAKRLARALGITVDHLVGAYEEDDVGPELWAAAVA